MGEDVKGSVLDLIKDISEMFLVRLRKKHQSAEVASFWVVTLYGLVTFREVSDKQ
jgi:hypothetical protein